MLLMQEYLTRITLKDHAQESHWSNQLLYETLDCERICPWVLFYFRSPSVVCVKFHTLTMFSTNSPYHTKRSVTIHYPIISAVTLEAVNCINRHYTLNAWHTHRITEIIHTINSNSIALGNCKHAQTRNCSCMPSHNEMSHTLVWAVTLVTSLSL